MTKLNAVWVCVVCAALLGCEENEPRPEEAVTEVGAPMGAAMTQMVGSNGATVRSADNKLEVIIPPGALAADTAISITPIEAKAPGAFAGWRLGPDGTTFAQPVTLRITPTQTDLLGSNLDFLVVAYQQEDRKWAMVPTQLEGSTITATTTHFSDWNAMLGFQILPGSVHMKPDKEQNFTVSFCGLDDAYLYELQETELVPLARRCSYPVVMKSLHFSQWQLNGRDESSFTRDIGYFIKLNKVQEVKYVAPTDPPPTNPIALSVTYEWRLKVAKPSKTSTTLLANIYIDSPGYKGPASAKIVSPQYTLEINADTMFWEERATNSYNATGAFTFKYTASDCDEYDGNGSFEGGTMTVYPPGSPAFPSTYNFTATATPTVTVQCGTPRRGVEVQVPVVLQAGFCSGAETVPYTDINHLTGSGPCAAQRIESSTWNFTAVQ